MPPGALRRLGSMRFRMVRPSLAVSFSPDGRLVAAAAAQAISLWDAATGREIRRLVGHCHNIYGLVFSPDGSHLVTGNGQVFETDGGRQVASLPFRHHGGHSAAAVAFSPDGRMVASGGGDGTVLLWRFDPASLR